MESKVKLAVALFLNLILFANCGGADAGFAHVSMIDNVFSPLVQRVPPGGVIQFINKGENPHNAMAVDKTWGTDKSFGNQTMRRGDKTKITFPEKGVFPYLCSFHASPDGKIGMTGTIVVGDAEFNPGKAGKKWKERETASGRTRRVPAEYPTIQNAVDASEPGDMILISPGIYKEEVVVTTPSLIIRGVDRNTVIVDGEFQRGNGIMVMGANGVAIENMTARNATLNGFFWTGVKGYRASYLTAINNGDYGVYAFDSTDGVFEYSYASGSPDSSYYVGQCYPCKAILHDLIGENSALGYSGTNSGGDLYLVRNLFRKNIVGALPNTLDSELLPPERETTLIANMIVDNDNPTAPIKPLTWPSFGNGIMIAGGLRNRIERNLVVGHPNHGIIVLPNLQENLWLSHDNIVKDNIVMNSGRADLALVGPIAAGNCFSGNSYLSAIPFGLEKTQGCDSAVRSFSGGDLSMMMGGLAMIIEAKFGFYKSGDYKTQPQPGPQPEMPDQMKKVIKPALNVFEEQKGILNNPQLPEESKAYLAALNRKSPTIAGSIQPLIPVSPMTMLAHIFLFLLPISVFAGWTVTAFYDLDKSDAKDGAKIGRGAMLLLLPLLGALIYHLVWTTSIPSSIKKTMLAAGAGIYIVILGVALPFVF